MKLIEIIEEQLLQNLRNKVQNVAQNVGNKVNSIVNKPQPQQPTQQNSNQLSTEFNQFVEKYKNINSDKTKMFGFGQSFGDDAGRTQDDAYRKARTALQVGKLGTTTQKDGKSITVVNAKGGFPIVDEKSYGIQDPNGKITWYHAAVAGFENAQQ